MKRVTQAEISAHLGLSQQAVSQWLKRLGLTTSESMDVIRLAYIDALRETAANRDLDLSAERAALAKAQRERIELDLAEKRKTLIPAEQVSAKWIEIVSNTRAKLLSLPTRLAGPCANQSPSVVEQEARKVIHEALTELAGRHEPA